MTERPLARVHGSTIGRRRSTLRSRALGVAALALLVPVREVSASEPVRATLTYDRRDKAATDCPDEATFRTLVQARLGYDPFAPAGPLAMRVELRPQGTEIAGRLLLTDASGEKRTDRTLRDADCFELASSMALATAIAVDPDAVRSGGARPPEPPPTPPTPPIPIPPVEPPVVREDPAPSAWSPMSAGARFTADFVMPVGLTPAPRGGVRVGAGIDGGIWSVVGEGAFLFPSSQEASFGAVTSSVAHGSLVPCAHLPLHPVVHLDLCAAGSVGAMFSDATEVARSAPQTHLYATVGPRGGVTVLPWPAFGIRAVFDAPVSLERAHLLIEQGGEPREVWAQSRVGFVGGLGLVVRVR